MGGAVWDEGISLEPQPLTPPKTRTHALAGDRGTAIRDSSQQALMQPKLTLPICLRSRTRPVWPPTGALRGSPKLANPAAEDTISRKLRELVVEAGQVRRPSAIHLRLEGVDASLEASKA